MIKFEEINDVKKETKEGAAEMFRKKSATYMAAAAHERNQSLGAAESWTHHGVKNEGKARKMEMLGMQRNKTLAVERA